MANVRDPMGWRTMGYQQGMADRARRQQQLQQRIAGAEAANPASLPSIGGNSPGAETQFNPTPANPLPQQTMPGMQPSGARTFGMPQAPTMGAPQPLMPQARSYPINPPIVPGAAMPIPNDRMQMPRQDFLSSMGMGITNRNSSTPYLDMLRAGRFNGGPFRV
jgi:hypothetical protein